APRTPAGAALRRGGPKRPPTGWMGPPRGCGDSGGRETGRGTTETRRRWGGRQTGPRANEGGEDGGGAIGEPASAFRETRPGHWLLDLYAVARARLEAKGVRRIYGAGYCTYTERERFFSYRRDHGQQRMVAAVWLP